VTIVSSESFQTVCAGIVEQHMLCVHSPMHLSELLRASFYVKLILLFVEITEN